MNNNCQEMEIDAVLIEQLLALPTPAQQFALLQESQCWHETAVACLLDEAASLVRSNPGTARRLAVIVTAVAEQLGLAEIVPRAAYIQAQTHALAGEFDRALELISAARSGYQALGQTIPALRTTAGLMHVLGESGQYQEALAAGQKALAEMGDAAQPELAVLAALIKQNMGMCYSLTGQYAEALAAYDAAEVYYLSQGMTAQASDISNNRGVLLWDMGRGSEALAALEHALSIRAAAGLTMLQAQSLGNVGSAHLLLGQYTQSLAAFEQARRLFTSLDVLVDQHVLLLDTATAYLTLNLYPEAQVAFEEAAHLLAAAGSVHHRARALWGLGATLLAQKQFDEAEQVLAEAIALLAATADAPTPLLATILVEQAAVQAARDQRHTAVTTATHALTLVADHEWPVPAIYAHLQLADLAQTELPQAETHLMATEKLLAPFNLPHLQYRLHQRLGRLRYRQGRHEDARMWLNTAVTEVEWLRGNLAQETMRTSFLHDKTAVYDDLIQLYLSWENEDGVAHAFTVAEQAKSRTLLDLMSGVLETQQTGQADDPEVARLQTLQADLNAIYNQMLGSDGLSGMEGQAQMIHGRAAELESAISQLRLRLAATGDAAELWAAPLPLETVQSHLPGDTTLLAYHIIEDDIIAFVIKQQSIQVVRHVGTASAVQALWRRLDGLLDRLRAVSAFSQNNLAALELSARRVLAAMYQAVVAPLADLLAAATDSHAPAKLTIIPHGCLHQIPFQALFDGQGYLIDRFDIAYAPSATIAWHCQQRPAMAVHNPLLVGVSDPTIPAVAAEIASAAAHLPQARVLLDKQATLAALRAEAADCDLLHLACHGLFRADNPMFSALKLHDGWLTASDAMHLRLRQALVTLSACESGRSQVTGGDELLGLLRAFLGSGAATVVVSLWLAQDDTTARLMAHWYAQLRQAGVSPTTALRESQLALKAEYPHPYFWAPFVAVGRR